MQHIYGLFGFEFHLELSTRPENYLGEIETWNVAEDVSASFYHIPMEINLNSVILFVPLATHPSSQQALPWKMGAQPRRWRLLWPQD